MMKPIFAICTFFALTLSASADVKVVATIKPIHSIAAQVMKGAGEPQLLLRGSSSPHTYAFTPRDAQAVQDAQIVFWVGPELEAFLKKPLATLGEKSWSTPLIEAPGLAVHTVREGEQHQEDGDALDAHIWLDPRNASAIADAMSAALAKVDIANASLYQQNAEALKAQLATIEKEIATNFAGTKLKRAVVFHDAYQYFEKRFGLPAPEALSIHPENPPGAAALKKIRNDLRAGSVACVFTEPQFDTKLVRTVTEGLQVKVGVLDPLGASIPEGPDMYTALIKGIATSWAECR
jgi:zinc transport system substrate-binding protein